MTLHMEAGHSITSDVVQVQGRRIRFVTEDDRTMFEVSINSDGKSIEVRGVDTTKHGSEIYSCMLVIEPRAGNTVNIRTSTY